MKILGVFCVLYIEKLLMSSSLPTSNSKTFHESTIKIPLTQLPMQACDSRYQIRMNLYLGLFCPQFYPWAH